MTIILATIGVFLVGLTCWEGGALFERLRWQTRYREMEQRIAEFVRLLDAELTERPVDNGHSEDRRAVLKLVKGERQSDV